MLVSIAIGIVSSRRRSVNCSIVFQPPLFSHLFNALVEKTAQRRQCPEHTRVNVDCHLPLLALLSDSARRQTRLFEPKWIRALSVVEILSVNQISVVNES